MPELELDVQLASNQDQIPSDERLKEWARKAIQSSENETELTIRIVDEDESRSLNLAYRGKDKPTNVLSFPFEAPEHVPMNLLGDLVICAPVVEMEARSQNKSSEAHWAHMVIHGVLHLQGFDHIEDQEAERMETLEIEILNDLGYANPYVEQASQSHE